MTGPRVPGKKPRKVRGCYNCSQRRVNCDRGTPQCLKCTKKGLQCLGLGTRYRFNEGVASRGKWCGKKIPVGNAESFPDKLPQHRDVVRALEECTATSTSSPTPPTSLLSSVRHQPTSSLDHVDHTARFLLGYFAEKVAPVMVAIDIVFNGYRGFILPMCDEDAVVRDAVLATAAFHLSLRQLQWKDVALQYHMAAIRGLNQRTQEKHLTDTMIYSNLSTMIILLIEDMVTGGKDFAILMRMVRSFVASQGGESKVETSPPGSFLIQQIRKMTLYAQPLLSEHSAIQSLARVSKKDLDFLYSCMIHHPQYSESILNLIDLIQKACEIYVCRANKIPTDMIFHLVGNFIDQAMEFNATSPGGHILVWAFFIVGAECSTLEHRSFITTQLQKLWICTGFANTLYAMKMLESVWKESSGKDWTQVIADQVETFIM